MKTTEALLSEAQGKKEKLMREKERILFAIRTVEQTIRGLEKRRKRELDAAAIVKIEAAGISIEEVLKLLEERAGKKEE